MQVSQLQVYVCLHVLCMDCNIVAVQEGEKWIKMTQEHCKEEEITERRYGIIECSIYKEWLTRRTNLCFHNYKIDQADTYISFPHKGKTKIKTAKKQDS